MSRRVLIVSSQVRSVHSGVGTYAAMILRGLAAVTETVDVTVATWDSEIDAERYPDFRWVKLGPLPKRDPTPGKFLTLGRRLVDTLDRVGGGPRCDVVHFLDAREGHAFVHSKFRLGVEVIGTVHDDYAALVGPNPWHYRKSAADPLRRFLFHRWLRRVEQRCYPHFDLLMVNSHVTGATVQREYGLDPHRMTRVALTIEPAVDSESRVVPENLGGTPSLVFCGGNFYRKGLDLCIRAMPSVLRELPGVRLHVVGDCSSAPRIRALARGLDVAHAVQFHGHVSPERAAACIAGADIFLMPSRTEALGLVYLEAYRAGVPVIAGNRGGVTEIVHDGESGLLVDSPAGIAGAVRRLHGDPALRRRVIEGGHAVLARRTPDRLIRATLDSYGLTVPPPLAGTIGPDHPDQSDQGISGDALVSV